MPLSTLRLRPRGSSRKTQGQDGVAVSFPVGLFHPLQHAGLSRRTPGRDSHMHPLVNNPPDKCFVFSLQMFRERSLKRAQGPIRERKAEA
jgi:hypothetical protein